MAKRDTPRSKSMVLFYVLVAYIILQFGWWAYMMVDLNQEVYTQQAQFEQLLAIDGLADVAQSTLKRKIWMIVGEGSIFIIIIILGIRQINKSFRKEIALANQQKNFLLSVTHELKSPLASAKLYLQTLQRRKDLPRDKQEEMIAKAIKDTDRLHSLVENILTATNIENNNFPLHKQSTDVGALVKGLIDEASETTGMNHQTSVSIPEKIILDLDTMAISSVVLNLYENAVKYAPKGTSIQVNVVQKQNSCVLTVADEGPGIEATHQERIFDKFFRVGSEETRKAKGTGLGLYITRRLVELHNGRVTVKDNTPKGSIFEVVLPR